MLIKEFTVTLGILALSACAGAQADRADVVSDHDEHHEIVLDGHGFHISSDMHGSDLAGLRREINTEIRRELKSARKEVRLALAEAQIEIDGLEINAHVDAEELNHTILLSVQGALEDALQGLEEAELEFIEDEANMAMEAEQLAREAEQMAREAESMKREAQAMRREAQRMKQEATALMRGKSRFEQSAPKAPVANSQPRRIAPRSVPQPAPQSQPMPANEAPLKLERHAFAPNVH